MALTFRVLGTPCVHRDGQPLRLPAGRPTALLVTLLVHTNQPVPVGTLVDELWGHRPPPSAVANLRSHISQLRTLLSGSTPGPPRLIAGTGGYQLRTHRGELDAVEFDRLVSDGHSALGRGELTTATTTLQQALAMWPTPMPAAPTGGPMVTAALDRLRERRIGALEAYFACHLELWAGNCTDLVARLRAHVAENPLRERAWAQLMTVLYRLGDIAGALEAFTAVQSILATDLGVQPSAELYGLRQAMLRRDPHLLHPRQRSADRSAGAVSRDSSPARIAGGVPTEATASIVPHELPYDVDTFVGRTIESTRLHTTLTGVGDRPITVTISGTPGIGKSALAIRASAAVLDHFPDGQIYLDLGGSELETPPLAPAELSARLVRSLRGPTTPTPTTLAEARALVRSLLFGRRVLLVLDNVADPAQVADLLPVRGGSALLLTARSRLSAIGGPHLRLGPLAEADAVELLLRSAGPHRINDGPADVVVDLCERLPLTVRTAGSRLAQHPHRSVASLAARLRDERHRLDELAIRSRLAASYRSLGDTAVAFRRLGLLRFGPVTADVLAALLDTTPDRAGVTLDRLVEAQLVDPVDAGRFRMSRLLWLYAAELAADDPQEVRDAAVRRIRSGHCPGQETPAFSSR
ncbi:hypothetical protein GCM10027280_20280 [Micromonospora polyrhachis]|uniref:DNA-binding SARP family transcriptional activator n=1 Tax=Micromonospora polyrhachis TaxID=1282883 RepID=A0A7W7WRY9_9ACTN|nr:AfsR/SARP family transcriptional regulator [Micromonospora polyrhachis]MBB4961756.1 DNA-binding SARP family transcriptional activator [Micromonospora polyrhachis]